MKKQNLILFSIIALLLIIIVGCKDPFKPFIQEENETEPRLPRVKGADYYYCTGLGYYYEQRIEEDFAEEYCVFPNGEECIAFDFITGECHREFTLCEQQGHTMRIAVEQYENYNATYGICIFSDSSYCREYSFFKGDCHVKWE